MKPATSHKRITPPARKTLIIAVLLFIGFAMRVGFASGEYRFHPDEALFSTFTRRAALNGDWLLHGDLDKPPLSIYANALSMLLFAAHPRETVLDFTPLQGEFAARLPSLFASLITIAAAYSIARRLFSFTDRAVWAAALLVFSPLSIVFSATAFTDGLMICCCALSALSATGGRWLWAGFWFGAGLAAKQQAVFFLPFIFMLGVMMERYHNRRFFVFCFPVLAWIIVLGVWDAARMQPVGFMTLAAANNPVSGLIRPEMILSRLTQWSIYLFSVFGLAAVPLTIGLVLSRLFTPLHLLLIDRALLLYVLAYLALHFFSNSNLYDRYALPLLLPLALVGSRGISTWMQLLDARLTWSRTRRLSACALASVTGILLVLGGWNAARGQVPVGGDAGGGRWRQYEGIDQLADYLNDKPVATVIYDRWLGWELGFYMGEWNDKRRVHFPTPDSLADGAAALDEIGPRYFIALRNEDAAPWLDALRTRGFADTLERSIDNFDVYRIDPPLRR